jgi:hypothetical protein
VDDDRVRVCAATQLPSTDSDQAAIRIDAVVTDANGRPIDLARLISNCGRALSFARLMRSASQLPKAGDVVQSIQTESGRTGGEKPGTRVFAFVLDEFHVSAGAAMIACARR